MVRELKEVNKGAMLMFANMISLSKKVNEKI